MKIVILNFSGRESGNCAAVSKVIEKHLDRDEVIRYHIPGMLKTRCGMCDYECLRQGARCAAEDDIVRVYEQIAHADITYYIVPNYCDYPCAAFFAFNERSCEFFDGDENKLCIFLDSKKRFIVVSNSKSENFAKAFSYQIPASRTPDILYIGAKYYGYKSTDSWLKNTPDAVKRITEFIDKDTK